MQCSIEKIILPHSQSLIFLYFTIVFVIFDCCVSLHIGFPSKRGNHNNDNKKLPPNAFYVPQDLKISTSNHLVLFTALLVFF